MRLKANEQKWQCGEPHCGAPIAGLAGVPIIASATPIAGTMPIAGATPIAGAMPVAGTMSTSVASVTPMIAGAMSKIAGATPVASATPIASAPIGGARIADEPLCDNLLVRLTNNASRGTSISFGPWGKGEMMVSHGFGKQ